MPPVVVVTSDRVRPRSLKHALARLACSSLSLVLLRAPALFSPCAQAVPRAGALGLLLDVILRDRSEQGDENAEAGEDVDDREELRSVAGRGEVSEADGGQRHDAEVERLDDAPVLEAPVEDRPRQQQDAARLRAAPCVSGSRHTAAIARTSPRKAMTSGITLSPPASTPPAHRPVTARGSASPRSGRSPSAVPFPRVALEPIRVAVGQGGRSEPVGEDREPDREIDREQDQVLVGKRGLLDQDHREDDRGQTAGPEPAHETHASVAERASPASRSRRASCARASG